MLYWRERGREREWEGAVGRTLGRGKQKLFGVCWGSDVTSYLVVELIIFG